MSICRRANVEGVEEEFHHWVENPQCLECGEDENLAEVYKKCLGNNPPETIIHVPGSDEEEDEWDRL